LLHLFVGPASARRQREQVLERRADAARADARGFVGEPARLGDRGLRFLEVDQTLERDGEAGVDLQGAMQAAARLVEVRLRALARDARRDAARLPDRPAAVAMMDAQSDERRVRIR